MTTNILRLKFTGCLWRHWSTAHATISCMYVQGQAIFVYGIKSFYSSHNWFEPKTSVIQATNTILSVYLRMVHLTHLQCLHLYNRNLNDSRDRCARERSHNKESNWSIGHPDKKGWSNDNFLISQSKLMLWVLKRTVSVRRFFWAPKT